MLWLISLALSPLEVARNAVAEGDADGDSQLNAAEFKSMMLESHAFRKAVFTALDQDKDGMLDAEPFEAVFGVERDDHAIFDQQDCIRHFALAGHLIHLL